ncbi:MAG: hypothetical protein ACFB0Z_07940 [Candidatus Phaeomarinobacter sp.]
MTANTISPNRPIHVGMPPLDMSGPPVSFFEFWPSWLFYAPIALQWCFLALWYRGPGLALLANPSFPDGGMAGESKAEIFDILAGKSKEVTAAWVSLTRTPTRTGSGADGVANDLAAAHGAMQARGLTFPIVAKPDIGCRGVGVQPIRCEEELRSYLTDYPAGATMVLQEMVEHEAEAGVFYVRLPGEDKGRIFSLTLKYFPHVIGDGVSTLKALIQADVRAGLLQHVYLPRHEASWGKILPRGEPFRLAFAGSHSRGTIFRDGAAFITPEMEQAFDEVAKSIPEFYIGRFDLRFESMAKLQRGEGFKLMEINGAGGEATHIWDRKTTLREAYATLFEQNRMLFEIGDRNRKRGFKPPSIWRLYQAHKREQDLYPHYPMTR